MAVPATLFNSLVGNKTKIETAHAALAQMEKPLIALEGLVAADWTPGYLNVPPNLQDNASKAAHAVSAAVANLETAISELQGIYDGYITPNAN